ncbi:MAG: molybdopterin molybdotransferase MoeA [Ramlibacter sp.]|nr:molybdopterin molybdotransferase MoeA [Ramlibacter sp.]
MIAQRQPASGLRPLDDALADLLTHAQPLAGSQTVSTFDADGRVLAQDCVSALQVPPQDNSSMDGYAVRSVEIADEGVLMPVSQRIPAGADPGPLTPGSAARIFTGAPIPAGADAVVMQEDCELVAPGSATAAQGLQTVRIGRVPQAGQWIRRAGEDVTRGAVVLARGQRLGPADIGLAANIGLDRLQVARRPRVALFSTGDELVMPGAVPPEQMKPGTIYNSNRYFLRSLLQRLGCELTDLGVVPDRRDATVDALRGAALDHDLILTSGGVSVGEEDHIKPAVESLGRLDFWQIAMKPGKPFAYGKVGAAHFIGLPGNPVSSFVTFVLLVRPFVLKLQGATAYAPHGVTMTAHFDWSGDKRREFLRVRRNADGGLDLFPNQSSGVLTSASWADGLVDNPAGRAISRGDAVRFIALAELLQ